MRTFAVAALLATASALRMNAEPTNKTALADPKNATAFAAPNATAFAAPNASALAAPANASGFAAPANASGFAAPANATAFAAPNATAGFLQLEKEEEEEEDHSGEFFEARENGTGPLDHKYERVVPAHFSAGGDDLFMKSMIMTYALEGKNKDGSPNGKFFLNEAQTRAAAAEVVETHKGLKGAAKAEYLKNYFPRTWAHFDVTKAGMIGVEQMPQFMRFMSSDQTLNLQ